MARKGLKSVTVYATEDQIAVLQQAAEHEHRSVSNFCLAAALAEAERVIAAKGKVTRKRA